MKRTENGFTLIESLFVLSILFIITFIVSFTFKPQFEKKESDLFLTQLKADLFYGQQYAISHQEEVTIIFSPDQHYYYIRSSYNLPPIIMRYYSKDVIVSPGSLPLNFKFSAGGIVSRFGSFFIQCGNKHYRMTILIGKGRFYVVEE